MCLIIYFLIPEKKNLLFYVIEKKLIVFHAFSGDVSRAVGELVSVMAAESDEDSAPES